MKSETTHPHPKNKKTIKKRKEKKREAHSLSASQALNLDPKVQMWGRGARSWRIGPSGLKL